MGGCCRCGSGSLSELSDDESEEDDEDDDGGRPVGRLFSVWFFTYPRTLC